MKHSAFVAGMSLGALLLGSGPLSAAPVSLQVCAGSSCWSGSYVIDDGVAVEWTNVKDMPNGVVNSTDSVSFTSNFDVVPVPVPASVWLFGSGLLGLFGLARRLR